eukprot:3805840-Pyramimonas_sp.AAC.1
MEPVRDDPSPECRLDQVEEAEYISNMVCDAVKNNFGRFASAVEIPQPLAFRGMYCASHRLEDAISDWVPLGFVIQVRGTYTFVGR